MSHDHHESLPGYSQHQLVTDGCGECEHRARSVETVIASLDATRFEAAWYRAGKWGRAGLTDGSDAEMDTVKALWAIQVQLEQVGVPIGTYPPARPLWLP